METALLIEFTEHITAEEMDDGLLVRAKMFWEIILKPLRQSSI